MRSRSSSTRRLASDRRRSSTSWRSYAGGSGLLFRPMSGRELEGPGHSDLMALDEQGAVQAGQALQIGEGRTEPVGLGHDGGSSGGGRVGHDARLPNDDQAAEDFPRLL